jgi:mono/diheme cytochrome c family protein
MKLAQMKPAATIVILSLAAAFAGCHKRGNLVQRATARARPVANPMQNDPRAWQAGAKLFSGECAPCHGKNREGTQNAPPLDQPEVWYASPGALNWILRNGSIYTGMPTFASLPPQQRWQIITFLRQDGSGASRSR